MELDETTKMGSGVVDILIDHFNDKQTEDRLTDFLIDDVYDNPNHRKFTVSFKAYDYFLVVFEYDLGSIGCSIKYSDHIFIFLKESQDSYEKTDWDIFCSELKEELELRIPDKFLEARGWK